MQKYPEVYSLENSLAILEKYKDELSAEQYEQNRSIICNHAIEGMFANEQDIIDLIKVDKGEKTSDEIINEYKKEWGVFIAHRKIKFDTEISDVFKRSSSIL
ncbi:hypothetical protein [uncultured Campylobacter sp.]|uniref:hypothetical protein n=1 Tax=uncultured Campylobacter sp. TaxID=218934 RepID=UPI0026379D0A|nr:hypothetical protein [uncultured Campylobacter sp.]